VKVILGVMIEITFTQQQEQQELDELIYAAQAAQEA
tara:strand:- start:297 stop:404 length:108 start_codon:yes stop_codon:yes gene_type:complete